MCLVSVAKATGALGGAYKPPQVIASVLEVCKLKFHLAYKTHVNTYKTHGCGLLPRGRNTETKTAS